MLNRRLNYWRVYRKLRYLEIDLGVNLVIFWRFFQTFMFFFWSFDIFDHGWGWNLILRWVRLKFWNYWLVIWLFGTIYVEITWDDYWMIRLKLDYFSRVHGIDFWSFRLIRIVSCFYLKLILSDWDLLFNLVGQIRGCEVCFRFNFFRLIIAFFDPSFEEIC